MLIEIISHRPKLWYPESSSSPCGILKVEVADYVASATQRKITRCDSTYYDMISDKIKHQKTWDWNNKIDFDDS